MRKEMGLPFVILCMIFSLAFFLGSCEQPTSSKSSDEGGEDEVVPEAVEPEITVFGSVGGKVVDATGAPLSGVLVSVTSGVANTTTSTTTTARVGARDIILIFTDTDGMFELTNLISGDHNIIIGGKTGTTPSTIATFPVHVPTLDELRDSVTLNPVPLEGTPVPATTASIIQQYDGHYFVNLDLNEDPAVADIVTVYPLTATITGTAKLKTSALLPDGSATVPGSGYRVIADFYDWNNGQPFTFTGDVDATTGVFSIANVPAVGDIAATTRTINLRLDTNSVIANDTSDADTAVSPLGIVDGILVSGETRNVGTHYFVATIAPEIVTFSPAADIATLSTSKFDPGTQTSPVPLRFTFNKAMNTSKGSITVKDNDTTTPEEYVFTATWPSNTVYNVAPAEMFEYGKIITVTFSGFESADGVPFTGGPYNFTVRDVLKLVSSNTWTAYGSAVNTVYFPTGGTITPVILTFNGTLDDYESYSTYISDANGIIPANIGLSGSTLTITPDDPLDYGTVYKVYYKVWGRLFENVDTISDATGTACGFTTEKEPFTFTEPTLTLDAARNFTLAGWDTTRTVFETGDSQFYVRVGKVAGADGYYLEWKETAKYAWARVTTALTPIVETSTEYVFLVSMADLVTGTDFTDTLTSGESFDFRIFAATTDGRASVASSSITMADATAPTAANGITAGLAATYPIGTPNNASATNVAFMQLRVLLSNSEALQMPTAADVVFSNTSFVSISYIGKSSASTIEIIIRIATSTDISGRTMTLTIRDAAGNIYDGNAGTAGNQGYIYTF